MQQSAVNVIEQHKHGKQTIIIDVSERDGGTHTTISCLGNGFDLQEKNQHNHIQYALTSKTITRHSNQPRFAVEIYFKLF